MSPPKGVGAIGWAGEVGVPDRFCPDIIQIAAFTPAGIIPADATCTPPFGGAAEVESGIPSPGNAIGIMDRFSEPAG